MRNSIGAIPPLVLPVDPLPDIYDRLIPLVVNNYEWWQDGLLRWAATPPPPGADRIRLPIPLPESLTADEEIAILAAIYDCHAAEAAQINPWRDHEDPSVVPRKPNKKLTRSFVRECTAAIHDLAPYHNLRALVPMLRQNWERDKSAIAAMITKVEQRLRETTTEVQHLQIPRQDSIAVDLAKKTIALNGGEPHDITSEQALRWVKVLADHPGDWISGADLITHDDKLDGVRTDKLRQYLPSEINGLIESKTGGGSRISIAVTRP